MGIKKANRVDSYAKSVGALEYAADVRYEGMLYGRVVRAPSPRGKIRVIRRKEDVDWSKIVFATADDIPGSKYVKMIANDMPFLAWDDVHYQGEPVALVAAPTLAEADAACRAVEIQMDTQEPILTLEELVEQHLQDAAGLSVLAQWTIIKENVETAFKSAEIILEADYTTPHQEQAYLETNTMTAIPEGPGRMRVEGSLQCPYYVAPAIAAMLNTDLDHLHVKAFPLGGAFGGKEDFPSLLGGHAALLAHLSGRPVRMILTRTEDMAFTTKRHPSWVRIRSGAKKDGSLCGVNIDIVFDGGAYVTMSPVVLSRGAIHAAGAYHWPAVNIRAVAYQSNTPPNGAFRGFGVPQTIYAIESHIDQLALACGMSPDEFRLKNRLRLGDHTATSQCLTESVGSEEVLQRALTLSDFKTKYQTWGPSRRKNTDRHAKGIGMAFYHHGAGFTGGGEAKIAAKVAIDLASDGNAHIRVASTEMGQGAQTVLPRIVARELGLEEEQVICDPADTRFVPDSGPTVASRTTMIVGGELAKCAQSAKASFLTRMARLCQRPPDTLVLQNGQLFSGTEKLGMFAELLKRALSEDNTERYEFFSQHKLAPHIQWDEAKHKGDAYAAYAWGCTIAEVEVDLDSYEVRVPNMYIAVDIGHAVDPLLAKGQVEGGTLQSMGYALCEEVGVKREGGFLRDRFQTYIIPTALDAPKIAVELVEIPYSRGPGGAKGLGEMPMNGGAPAIANAIAHALGVRVRALPITAEKIYSALQGKLEKPKRP